MEATTTTRQDRDSGSAMILGEGGGRGKDVSRPKLCLTPPETDIHNGYLRLCTHYPTYHAHEYSLHRRNHFVSDMPAGRGCGMQSHQHTIAQSKQTSYSATLHSRTYRTYLSNLSLPHILKQNQRKTFRISMFRARIRVHAHYKRKR